MTTWQVRRFFIHSIWRQRSRTGFAAVMVAISVMFSLILTSITVGIDQTVRSIVGVQFALDTIHASPSINGQPLNHTTLASIRALSGVASADPYFTFLSRATLGVNRIQLNLISIGATAPEVQRLELRSGRSLQQDDKAAIILNERTIRAMGILDPEAALNQTLTILLRRGLPPSAERTEEQPTPTVLMPSSRSVTEADANTKAGSMPQPLSAPTGTAQSRPPASATSQAFLVPTEVPSTEPQREASLLNEFTHEYTATIVGIAKSTINDRAYLSSALGLDMASWQSYMEAPKMIEQNGYNGIQVVANQVEDVRTIQRELAALQLSTESALDSASQAQGIVDRIQLVLVVLLIITGVLALVLTYGSIQTTIRSCAQQIGTLLLVGAPPRQVRGVLNTIAFAVVLPGALAGLLLSWIAITAANYAWSTRVPDATIVLALPFWMPVIALLVALVLGMLASILVWLRLRRRSISQLLWDKKE